ncbi:MAG: hypothetical protein GY909_02075, partial [Oligoflexia bacterium]|nr:hypothetical protein [Oligoflexia bacterium]
VFNWFYRIIERTGHYPAPKGYKSFEQKQLQRERQLIEEREKRIQELKEIHCKKWEQERDLEFWEMMNNPKGELYKECYARLNSFQRDFKNGKMFEMAMVKAFDEIMLERDKDKVVGDKES